MDHYKMKSECFNWAAAGDIMITSWQKNITAIKHPSSRTSVFNLLRNAMNLTDNTSYQPFTLKYTYYRSL
jgi:hypothetical protein